MSGVTQSAKPRSFSLKSLMITVTVLAIYFALPRGWGTEFAVQLWAILAAPLVTLALFGTRTQRCFGCSAMATYVIQTARTDDYKYDDLLLILVFTVILSGALGCWVLKRIGPSANGWRYPTPPPMSADASRSTDARGSNDPNRSSPASGTSPQSPPRSDRG